MSIFSPLLRRLLMLALLVCLLMTVFLSAALSIFSPESWAVTYASRDRSGYWALYRMDVDHRLTVPLTRGLFIITEPVLSPDDRLVAWPSLVGDTFTVADRLTGQEQVVGLNAFYATKNLLVWSPDSRRLAYFDLTGLRLVEHFSGGGTGLAETISLHGLQPFGVPIWHPDGSQIVFYADPGDDIYRFDLSTGEVQPLTDEPAQGEYDPVWSPDGAWLAYSLWDGRTLQLWALHPESGERRLLADDVRSVEMAARWSPDGRRIAFISGRNGVSEVAWTRLAAEPSGTFQRVSLLPSDRAPVWSPDGRRIAFVNQNDNDLYWTYVPDVEGRVPFPAFRLTDNNAVNILLR
ncbi:MAG: hypothetical protein SF029_20020 [bacterium]|nr:hypothetical protein [bacterium]